MEGIAQGESKVCSEGHTLILGWNESTVRLVCQIAFLRRAWRIQNETFARSWLRIGRVPPSSPVARAPVVIMTDKMTKEKMEEILGDAMAERGISPKRTRLGWDIVCRVGNPGRTHDLVVVNAHRATSVVIMMTEEDEKAFRASGGKVQNGATIRTALALRNNLLSSANCATQLEQGIQSVKDKSGTKITGPDGNFVYRNNGHGVRIVVQLSAQCKYHTALEFPTPISQQKLMYPMDLSVFMNKLLFWCTAKPGLAKVLSTIIDFESTAIRCRPAYMLELSETAKGTNRLVGKTMKQAITGARWWDGFDSNNPRGVIIIGVDNGDPKNPGGVAPDPNYVIKENDNIIFLSSVSKSKPVTSRVGGGGRRGRGREGGERGEGGAKF